MRFFRVFSLSLFFGFFVFIFAGPLIKAQEIPTPELYKVTMLRAEPGKLPDLIEFLKAQKAAGFYQAIGEEPPLIMRHSQGDHWDLFLLQPIGSYQAYFSGEKNTTDYVEKINSLSVFREELFAYGPPSKDVRRLYRGNSFFHIEMFAALAGKHQGLLNERIMENEYLIATGRNPNLIFVGDMGSDIDSFTIGFYPSIVDFAAPAPVSPEVANEAAITAGFEGRNTIGFYLREFLAYHHDTLAVKVE